MALIFSSGFETGDFSEFTAVSTGATVVTTPVYAGVYAARITPASNGFKTSGVFNKPDVYMRTRVFLDRTTPVSETNSDAIRFLSASGAVIGKLQLRMYASGGVDYRLGYPGVNFSNLPFPIGQWVDLEFRCKIGVADGIMQLRINGAIAQDLTGLPLGSANIADIIFPAPTAGTYTVGHDNIAVDDATWATFGPAPTAIVAAGLVTGTPALGAPVLGQTHVLTPAGISAGAPVLGTPALGGASTSLTASGITTGAPTVGSPALGGNHTLVAAGIQLGAPTLGTPSLSSQPVSAVGGIRIRVNTAGVPIIGEFGVEATPEIGAPTSTIVADTPLIDVDGNMTINVTAFSTPDARVFFAGDRVAGIFPTTADLPLTLGVNVIGNIKNSWGVDANGEAIVPTSRRIALHPRDGNAVGARGVALLFPEYIKPVDLTPTVISPPIITANDLTVGSIWTYTPGEYSEAPEVNTTVQSSTDGAGAGIIEQGLPLPEFPDYAAGLHLRLVETAGGLVTYSAWVGPIAPRAQIAPAPPNAGLWGFNSVIFFPSGQTDNFVPDLVWIDPSLGTVGAKWTTAFSGASNAVVEQQSEPMDLVDAAQGLWRPRMRDGFPPYPDRQFHHFDPTKYSADETRRAQFSIRIQVEVGGLFSPRSDLKIVNKPPIGTTPPPPVTTVSDGKAVLWSPRYQLGFQDKIIGGSGGQFPIGYATCEANPDLVYWTMDVNLGWMTKDFGLKWFPPRHVGMHLVSGSSAAFDPADQNRMIICYGAGYAIDPGHLSISGIYLSTDQADTANLVYRYDNTTGGTTDRWPQNSICYDPQTRNSAPLNRRWAVALASRLKGGARLDGDLIVSNDGGRNWAKRGERLTAAKFGAIYRMVAHPTQAGTFYLGTEKGLFRTTNDFITWQKIGGLPTGRVRQVDVDDIGSGVVWVSVDANDGAAGNGLYKSTNSGTSFTRNTALGRWDIKNFMIHPKNRSRIMVGGRRSGPNARWSHNGGGAWQQCITKPQPGEDAGFHEKLFSDHVMFIPDPRDANIILAQGEARFSRSIDGGKIFEWFNTDFNGDSCYDVGFDESNWQRMAFFPQDYVYYETRSAGDWRTSNGLNKAESTAVKASVPDGKGNSSPYVQPEGVCMFPSGRISVGCGHNFRKRIIQLDSWTGGWQLFLNVEVGQGRYGAVSRQNGLLGYTGKNKTTNGGNSWFSLGREFTGMSRQNGNIIYGVTSDDFTIFRSTDAGASWSVWATLPKSIRPFDGRSVMQVDPHNGNRVWVSQGNASLARVDNGNITANFPLNQLVPNTVPRLALSRIAIDFFNPQLIYISFSDNGFDPLFRSQSGGGNWENISKNVPAVGTDVFVHPLTSDVITISNHGRTVQPPPPGHRQTYGINNSVYDRVQSYRQRYS